MSLAMRDRVGLVVERDQAGDRAEDLFLRDPHAVVDVGEHGRQHVVARRARDAGSVGRVEAAAQQRRAFLRGRARCSCAPSRGAPALIIGPTMVFSSSGSPTVMRLRALGEPRREVGVDRLLHQDARAGGAALAVVREDHEDGRVERALEVGVVEDDERALAAELHAELLQAGRSARCGCRSRVEPVNEIARTSRMRAPAARRPPAVAVHDVQHAGRNAGLERQLAEARGRERRQLAHLQHRGVAEREAGRDLPGRRHERHVPRARSARTRRPGGTACSSGAWASDRCGRRRACTSRRSSGSCRPRAAPAACRVCAITWPVSRVSVSRDLGHVLRDQVAELAHQLRALGARQSRPRSGTRPSRRRRRRRPRLRRPARLRPAPPAWPG